MTIEEKAKAYDEAFKEAEKIHKFSSDLAEIKRMEQIFPELIDTDKVIKCLINGMKFYYEDNEEATWGTDKWSMPVKYIIEVLEQILANSAKTCSK
jgi:predicted 3-demethylubiquinone-9 3-methyltransferase (glyoxalase superfamily)